MDIRYVVNRKESQTKENYIDFVNQIDSYKLKVQLLKLEVIIAMQIDVLHCIQIYSQNNQFSTCMLSWLDSHNYNI